MSEKLHVDGTILPFPQTPSASIAGRTMQESVYNRRVTPRRLPADAPNILIVLIDDAGPGLQRPLQRGRIVDPVREGAVQDDIAVVALERRAVVKAAK